MGSLCVAGFIATAEIIMVSQRFQITLFFATFVAAGVFSSNISVNCTDEQNRAKITSAQAVLDCGTKLCSNVMGKTQQACLCKHCHQQNRAADAAACTCGLEDPNSKAACGIYKKLSSNCSGVAGLCAPNVAILFVLITATLATHYHW